MRHHAKKKTRDDETDEGQKAESGVRAEGQVEPRDPPLTPAVFVVLSGAFLRAMCDTMLAELCTAAIIPRMKTFGHSIKAGHLPPAGNEVTTFEHTCGNPPCCLTQLHYPTAGPDGWELFAILRVYVDGEATASINVTLLELANVGQFAPDGQAASGKNASAAPWGVRLFGHTAKSGGVYSTMQRRFKGFFLLKKLRKNCKRDDPTLRFRVCACVHAM